ncbi:hypothetical protein ANTPLA_LOCUS7860 [Anthophora plagiata]
MDNKEFMTDVYNTLVQIRYPRITTTVAENIESTVLSGENRVSLLSWLLTEKSPTIASKLQKLKGADLKAQLLKYYSEIGICNDEELLLGDCPLEKQLSTLKLLLDFIKCIFIESCDTECNEKKSINDILNVYINEDPNRIASNIEPKLNYSESVEYFNNLEKFLKEYQDSSSVSEHEKEIHVEECHFKDEEDEGDKEYQDSLFNTEKAKFIEAFSTIESWSVNNANDMHNSHSMDTDINEIYLNFSSLKQFLQAKEEISNVNIRKEINKLNTALSEIIEDAVTNTEKAKNVCMETY